VASSPTKDQIQSRLRSGRIAGISGIVAQVLPPLAQSGSVATSVLFIVGLLLGAPIYYLVTGSMPAQSVVTNPVLLIIAGLAVGFGSVFGNGCTSGHGVCGISRFSMRSIVATVTFMLTAGVTVYLLRHGFGA